MSTSHTATSYGRKPSGPSQCTSSEIRKGVQAHTKEVIKPSSNIYDNNNLTLITLQVAEAAVEATKAIKEEDTQEEANNNSSTSEEFQEEAGEGEDTDAAPHRVHDNDLEGPVDTESSNYATLYVNIEATLLVNSEYNNPNLTKPAIKLNSNPVSNLTANKAKNIIHLKRDIPINKELHIETKPNDDVTLKKVNNEIQPDVTTLI